MRKMNTSPAPKSEKASPLAFIVTQTRGEFDLNGIYKRLRENGFGFVAVEDYEGVRRPRIFYLEQVREEMPDVSMLIAGRGIPIEEMLHVVPNLRTAYTTDPFYRHTISMVNGGPNIVSIIYIDPSSPVSNNQATQMILSYLSILSSPKPV